MTRSLPLRAFPWQHLTELELCHDLLRSAGIATVDVPSEQLRHFLANHEEWWGLLCSTDFCRRLLQLTSYAVAQFKLELLSTSF